MNDDKRIVLLRLKRRLGREAVRYEKMADSDTCSAMGRERAYGEANVLRMAQGFIDDELRKAAKR